MGIYTGISLGGSGPLLSSKLRALCAALLVVALALGGALYLGYKSGVEVGRSANSAERTTDVASLDLQSLLGSGTGDQHLLDLAFRHVEDDFYKPVNAQTLLDGEHHGIVTYLRSSAHLRNVALPIVAATGDATLDKAKLNSQLAFAQTHYGSVRGASNADITESAIRGMMDALKDPYTVYLAPKEIQALNESLSGGNFGGIGVYIVQDPKNGDILIDPIESLPAARAGLKPGDLVLAVDGHPTKGLKLDQVERMIRGNAGTVVHIQTRPYKKTVPHTYAIVRQTIHVPTVKQKMTPEGYDYIRLSDFGDTSADEIHKALLAGKAKGAKGYILDLRDNGGGLLDAAVKISSFFIPSGPIVSTINRQGQKDTANATGEAIPGLSPLVILVNKYTASASEITSGALQDDKLAYLIGTKTFGKGVVQSIYPMPDNGALKITTARYVTPLGRDIQHKGIMPDQVIAQSPDPSIIETRKDAQLNAAKAYLKRARR